MEIHLIKRSRAQRILMSPYFFCKLLKVGRGRVSLYDRFITALVMIKLSIILK